jgi:hypothetical protein
MSREATARRLIILRFLAEQTEPVLIRDVASGCQLEVRQARLDIRALSAVGWTRQRRHRGVLPSGGKMHTTVYLAVGITDKGRKALTEAA